MRRVFVLAAAIVAVLAACVGAWAYITGNGGGTGTALVGSLTAPAPQGVTAPSGKPRLSWTAVRPGDAEVSYEVARTADGGLTWTPADGGCAGTLPAATLTCDDDPPAGTYVYRVTATFHSWSSSGLTGPVSTLNTTALDVTAPAAGSTGVAVPASALAASLSGATASPAAGGAITFSYFGPQATPPASCQPGGSGWTALGTATVTGNGTYSPAAGSFTPGAAGTYWWYASYGGDTLNRPSTSSCGAVSTVVTNITSLSVAAPVSGTVGTAIAAADVTAALAGSAGSPPPGATVTLSSYGPSDTPPVSCQVSGGGWTALGLTLTNGNGSYAPSAADITPDAPGAYWWFASYSGDTLEGGSTSACGAGMASTLVERALPALSVGLDGSPAAGIAGTPVPPASITGSLTGRAFQDGSGGVAFFYVEQDTAPTDCAGGTAIGGAVGESAAADYHPDGDFTPLTAGTYWIYAVYSGDGNNLPVSGTCPPGAAQELDVAKAQPALSLAVDGAPAAGTAGTPFPAASITATLGGRVSPDGAGSVTFFSVEGDSAPADCSGGTQIGGPVTEVDATHPDGDFTPATAGTYWLYAVYSGDANNLDATGTCAPGAAQELVVAKAQPSLTLSVTGNTVTATLGGRVSQDTTGAVTFFYVEQDAAPADCTLGTQIGTPVSESAADGYQPAGGFTPTAVGTYWLYAVYSGDANNLGTSGNCPPDHELQVAPAQPTLSLAVTGGSITATLDGRANQDGTGTVSFFYLAQAAPPTACTGGTAIGSPVAEMDGTSYQPSTAFTPASGTYWIYALYSGDGNNLGASGTCPPGAAQRLVVP